MKPGASSTRRVGLSDAGRSRSYDERVTGNEGEAATFTAHVQSRSRGGIAIELPFDPSVRWADRDAHHVRGTVDGRPVRGTLVRVDGCYRLELGQAWCRDCAVEAGGEIMVTLMPEGPLLDTIAEDIASAIRADASAARFFESLPTFYRNNYIRWIEDAKRPPTRARRIQESVVALCAGQRERGS